MYRENICQQNNQEGKKPSLPGTKKNNPKNKKVYIILRRTPSQKQKIIPQAHFLLKIHQSFNQ